jgi:hypothetical protein
MGARSLACALAGCAVALAAPGARSSAHIQSDPTCTDSWASGSSGSWSNGANWSTGAAPTADDDACIDGPVTVTVAESDVAIVHSLTIDGGGGIIRPATLRLWCSTLTARGGIISEGFIELSTAHCREPVAAQPVVRIDLRGGTLRLQGSYDFGSPFAFLRTRGDGLSSIEGNLVSGANGFSAIVPGPGALSVTGDFDYTGSIDPTLTPNGCGVVRVGGDAILKMRVFPRTDYRPPNGTTFQIVTAGAGVSGTAESPSRRFDTRISQTGVELVAR